MVVGGLVTFAFVVIAVLFLPTVSARSVTAMSPPPQAVTAAIPEESKLLGRSLGKSVRSGMLNKNRAVAAAKCVDSFFWTLFLV